MMKTDGSFIARTRPKRCTKFLMTCSLFQQIHRKLRSAILSANIIAHTLRERNLPATMKWTLITAEVDTKRCNTGMARARAYMCSSNEMFHQSAELINIWGYRREVPARFSAQTAAACTVKSLPISFRKQRALLRSALTSLQRGDLRVCKL